MEADKIEGLRLTSDGTPSGTALYDIKTGRRVDWKLRRVNWSVTSNSYADAALELYAEPVQAFVDGKPVLMMTDPRDGIEKPVARIEFKDGSAIEFA